MAGYFKKGQWVTKQSWEQDATGAFVRQETGFRGQVQRAETNRYHLYVAYACPWAHRTLLVRALMGLEASFTISSVHPLLTQEGWHFAPDDSEFPSRDTLYDEALLRTLYQRSDPKVSGRVTVPILWDKSDERIVNNESREIITLMATVFQPLATQDIDLYPPALRATIDQAIDQIYGPVNNGVYRCGFAGTQLAYEEAMNDLYAALDHWEHRLGEQRFVAGDQLTLADLVLFPTLYRFDPVYSVHFKTNRRLIHQYPNLWAFLRDVYGHPGVAETCRMDRIKHHYYRSHPHLNPTGIIASGPELDYNEPHRREGWRNRNEEVKT